MKHTKMPWGYQFSKDYEKVGTACGVARAPDNLPKGGRAGFYGVIYSHVDRAWAIIEYDLLGFYCVIANIDKVWVESLRDGIDQELIKMRKAK